MQSMTPLLQGPRRNSKLAFYLRAFLSQTVPDRFYLGNRSRLLQAIPESELDAVWRRVEYYNKLNRGFAVEQGKRMAQLSSRQQSAYFCDLRALMRYFPAHARFHHEFGDVIQVPSQPCLLKSRPIAGNNQNSVLLKLNQVRHYVFVKDPHAFTQKTDSAVWRGKAKPGHHRSLLVQDWFRHPRCDIGQSNKVPIGDNPEKQKARLSIEEQLRHKFVISAEGNDVATNLKWILSSNSLCLMRRPRYETWFMEGRLQAGVHYVQLRDDFADLEETIDYYCRHTDEALAIIHNAQQWVLQFRNATRERQISLLVLQKYLRLAGELAEPDTELQRAFLREA